jgi:serine/threonine protein kinase/Tfp pilus assembly protein PilF
VTPDRFARLKELFLTVPCLPEADRGAYLDEACQGDPALRREVESLLDRPDRAPDVMRTGGMASILESRFGAAAPVGERRPLPGRIGPYAVRGILGEGGMGVVYRAEQMEPIRREVALKLIKRGMDTDRVVARFEAERQTLARMDHPSIAKVLDAGADEHGQPYFVMELVRGLPLTEYCENRDLATRQRLDLFRTVCRAVQHAHGKGIVHRDLKPSNILVTEQDGLPLPKIIDWGIAKATQESSAEKTALTQEGQLVGTLDYMSPEQAGGDRQPLDLRTDVYSLGVILYELLTGDLPFDTRERPVMEAARVILEEPPRSFRQTGLRPRQINRDIETILFKALEKERDRRYSSAGALADDIDRFLSSRPILARPPSTAYQLKKLVARHKAPFAFLAALFVLLTASSVTMSLMYEGQRRERLRAEKEARKAERINEFLQEMLASADPRTHGRDVTVKDVVDAAGAGIDSSLAEEPEVQAAVRQTLAVVYMAIDECDAAEKQLDSALVTLRRTLGEEHNEVASVMDNQSFLHWRRGEYARAESLSRIALAIHEESGDVEGILVSMNNLGSFVCLQNRPSEAGPILEETVRRRREFSGETNPELAINLNQLAWFYFTQGRYEDCERLVKESLAIRRGLYPDGPNAGVAQSLQNLGVLLRVQGEYDEAEPLLRESAEMNEELFGEEHVGTASARGSYAEFLEAIGILGEAETLHRGVLSTSRKILGEQHPQVIGALLCLNRVLAAQGQYAEAEAGNDEALRLAQRAYGEKHDHIAVALGNRAAFLQMRGRHAEAESTFHRALDMLRTLHGEEHITVANALHDLALLHIECRRWAEAEGLCREALALRLKWLRDWHPAVAATKRSLASILVAEGRPGGADSLLRESLKEMRAVLPPDHWEIMLTLNELGLCLAAQGRKEEAVACLDESCHDLLSPPDHPLIATRDALERTAKQREAWGEKAVAAEYRSALRRLPGRPGQSVPPENSNARSLRRITSTESPRRLVRHRGK